MDYDKYYENCSKPQKRALDILEQLEKPIIATELSETANINNKNLSKVMKDLVLDGVVKEKTVSPKRKKVRYKYFSLNDDLDDIEIIEMENKKKINETAQKVKIIKQNVDTIKLKDEILDEIKKSFANNSVIQECKTEIIKFINVIPIRKIDKDALGYKGMTSNEVRNHMIDLLNQMSIFKP